MAATAKQGVAVAHPDVVLWNPGAEKAAKMGDLGAGRERRMVCVEPGLAVMPGQRVQLRPGESAWLRQTIDLVPAEQHKATKLKGKRLLVNDNASG